MGMQQKTWFDRQADQFERGRFGWMTVYLTAQSCWGSIAAMLSLRADDYISLGICASVTMASNAAFIAQGPAKWCLGLLYLSAVTNLLLIMYHLIF